MHEPMVLILECHIRNNYQYRIFTTWQAIPFKRKFYKAYRLKQKQHDCNHRIRGHPRLLNEKKTNNRLRGVFV